MLALLVLFSPVLITAATALIATVSPPAERSRIVQEVSNVGQEISKIGRVAMVLVGFAGAALTVIAYLAGRDSTDAQEALVVPFMIYWTAIAVSLVFLLDRFIGHLRRSFARPSEPE